MSLKINLHNKKREAVSTADKPWLGKRVKTRDGREMWSRDPQYATAVIRPLWDYFDTNPSELEKYGLKVYWKGPSGDIQVDKNGKPLATVWYDKDMGLITVKQATASKPYNFYPDEDPQNLIDFIKDLASGKGWHESKQSESYYIDMYSRWGGSMGRVTGDTIKDVVTQAAEQMDWLSTAEIRRMVKKSSETKGEAYYSQGNRDGRKYAPMKTQESFPNRAAFLSYKKGYNEALDGIYEETGDPDFDKEVKDLKSKPGMDSLVSALDGLTDEQLALLEKGFGDGEYAEKMNTAVMDIKAKDLHPTQNEIDVGKSLSYQISGKNPDQVKQILDGGPVTINLPLVVYDYNGTYYIVDGHHRWSQVFLLNPNCQINSIVFKNSAGDTAQDPADMLRDFQGAIAIANDGEVPQSTVKPGMNMFDWSSDQLRDYLEENIQDGMVSAYQDFYNSEIDKEDIENSVVSNAGLMKKSNKPINNAPSRAVMPQTDTGVDKTGVAGLEIAKKGMTDL